MADVTSLSRAELDARFGPFRRLPVVLRTSASGLPDGPPEATMEYDGAVVAAAHGAGTLWTAVTEGLCTLLHSGNAVVNRDEYFVSARAVPLGAQYVEAVELVPVPRFVLDAMWCVADEPDVKRAGGEALEDVLEALSEVHPAFAR